MICKQFLDMTPLEQSTYMGKIVHAVQNCEQLFLEGEKLIRKAERKGLFNGVKINPLDPPNNIDA